MENGKDVKGVFQYWDVLYVPEIIYFKVISCQYNDLIVKYFGIDKTRELIAKKYYSSTLYFDVETYIQRCNICLGSKTVCYKSHRDLQLLLVLTHCWKNLSMNFITGLPLSVELKGDNYELILVIINHLTKIVNYEPIKITINAPGLAKVIINLVIQYHSFPNFIISDWKAIFIFKFWFLLYYFFGIK